MLTPLRGQVLRDSLTEEKTRKRARDEAAGTLFEAAPEAPPARHDVAPDDAYWLELKVVAQFSVESGVPGPNSAYGSQITRFAAADIGKLSCDRTIVHAGLALVLFTATKGQRPTTRGCSWSASWCGGCGSARRYRAPRRSRTGSATPCAAWCWCRCARRRDR